MRGLRTTPPPNPARPPILLGLRWTGVERDRPADHDSAGGCSKRRKAGHLRRRERVFPCMAAEQTTSLKLEALAT